MSLYLLDTNICVHLLKGEYQIKPKLAEVGVKSCFLSEITIAELLFGIENSAPDRRKQNLERFNTFQTLFSGRILSIGEALHEYARQKATLRRIGRPVGEFDLLIGSTAIIRGFILVTRNTKDFSSMNGIQLENWVDD
ncbi:PIN domain-containing protein [Spirosoma foliorum]|uniref:PIN domain-containing protein n=1 Tax=Spirosoma foliorum TaxID=2710596 RepID=A0A7G5GNV4_9BACT|nr:PIN domain-containing protein [Spirosoma foliorum]QMW00546.1 PIN domain-containing protein [Spirosoma foliorum]